MKIAKVESRNTVICNPVKLTSTIAISNETIGYLSLLMKEIALVGHDTHITILHYYML